MGDKRTFRGASLLAGSGAVLALAALSPASRGEDRTGALEATAPVASPASGVKVMEVGGAVHVIGTAETRATALVFLSTECPIAQKYVPELNALAKHWGEKEVPVFAVLSEPTVTREQAAEFVKKYAVSFPVIFDASGELATRLRPTRTPEAFVLGQDGAVLYRGRIDDTWRDLGKLNARVSHHDLDDAIAAASSGKTTASTTPVGCAFEPWQKDALPAKPSYARDVAPILQMHCTSCHRPGAIAPFSLLTYDDVSKRARTVAQVTQQRYMPPWHAEPGFGHFRDERRLSGREIAILAAWKDQGAPEGASADLPPAQRFTSDWELGEPDLVVKLPRPFDIPASGNDVYRCFVLRTELPEDRYVVATQFRPGAPTVVHHCITYLDTRGVARKKEEAAGGFGYPSFGGPGFAPTGALGGWAPGATPTFLPEGMARSLPKGADIVVQIHYHPNGKAESDQSSLGIYFAKKPVKFLIHDIPLINHDVDIPAGEAHYKRTIDLRLPVDVTVVGIVPHMHLLGREMKVTATLPSGEVRPGIWIKDWDFRWQDQYKYDKPYTLPRGSKVEVEAYYDNSSANPVNPNSPPKRVTWGEQTTDEMCLCFVEIAVPNFDPTTPAEAPKKKKKYY